MPARAVNLRAEAYDVYVGRAGRGESGYFGNDSARGAPCPTCGRTHLEGASTLPCYLQRLNARLREDAAFRRRVAALAGLRLGCFCKPAPCHGDLLAERADAGGRPMPRHVEALWIVRHRRAARPGPTPGSLYLVPGHEPQRLWSATPSRVVLRSTESLRSFTVAEGAHRLDPGLWIAADQGYLEDCLPAHDHR